MSLEGLALGGVRYSNSRPVKRTVDFHGLTVSIELEVGETLDGLGEDGIPWSVTYAVPYGEIPDSKTLSDGEGVDVYVGTDIDAPNVFVVHQLRKDGTFDEDKVILCVTSAQEAKQVYTDHGPSWGFGGLDTMTVDEFLRGYLASNRKI